MIVVELVHVDKLYAIATKDMPERIAHKKFEYIKQLIKIISLYFHKYKK